MAQAALVTNQLQVPQLSTKIKDAQQLQQDLTDIAQKLGSHPDLRSRLNNEIKQINSFIREGRLDSPNAEKTFTEVKSLLDQIAKLKFSPNSQGLIEEKSKDPNFSKEIVIPISALGLKKHGVEFQYTIHHKDGSKSFGDFGLSSSGVRAWRDNLMDVSVNSTEDKLTLKVYRRFEGDISFNIKEGLNKLSQRAGVISTNFQTSSSVDTSHAMTVLNQLSSSLNTINERAPRGEQSGIVQSDISISSEVKGLSVSGINYDSKLYATLKMAKQAGIDVVLTKYAGANGEVEFEMRKGGKRIAQPINLSRDFNKDGKDYFAERNEKLVSSLTQVLTDKENGMSYGTTALNARLAQVEKLVTSSEFKSALGELEYSNSTNKRNGNLLREQWKKALSSTSVRSILRLDQEDKPVPTEEMIAQASKQLTFIETNVNTLISWAKTNNSNLVLQAADHELNFSLSRKKASEEKYDIDKIIAETEKIKLESKTQSQTLEPSKVLPLEASKNSNIEHKHVGDNLHKHLRNDFMPPEFLVENRNFSAKKANVPVEIPELILPSLTKINNSLLPQSMIAPPHSSQVPLAEVTQETKPEAQVLTTPLKPISAFDQITKDLKLGEPRRITPEEVSSLGINTKLLYSEIVKVSDKEFLLRGINPDNLTQQTYLNENKEQFLAVNKSYDALDSVLKDSIEDRPLTQTSNINAEILNGSIAESILTKSQTTSVAQAFVTEYFLGTSPAASFFSGSEDQLKQLFFDSNRINLQFLPSLNLVHQNFNDLVQQILKTNDGSLRINNSELPAMFEGKGDIIICARIHDNIPELMITSTKLEPKAEKELIEKLTKEQWSIGDEVISSFQD